MIDSFIFQANYFLPPKNICTEISVRKDLERAATADVDVAASSKIGNNHNNNNHKRQQQRTATTTTATTQTTTDGNNSSSRTTTTTIILSLTANLPLLLKLQAIQYYNPCRRFKF